MTKDELYPIIDEVLHKRTYPYTNAGSYWIDHTSGDVQLNIHELNEALCDAIVAASTKPAENAADDIVKRLAQATSECPCRRPTIGSQIISCCSRCDAEHEAIVGLESRDAEIETLTADCAAWEVLCKQRMEHIDWLRSALAIAAGMISTLPPYEHQHSQTVMDMLLEEARRG